MIGHLAVAALHDAYLGRTRLGSQSFAAPMHIGKGYWCPQAKVLTVQTVNATAGLFAGDRVDWRVCVQPGARLRLVSPSATRVFRQARPSSDTCSSDEAFTGQTFEVAGEGSWLEVWPEGFIPHAGCRHRQVTRLDVAAGGAALLCEILAPGRVAAGEAWKFARLRWSLDVSYAGRAVVRERWDLRPLECPASLAGWRLEDQGPFTAPPLYASLFLIGGSRTPPEGGQSLLAGDRGESMPGCWIGSSRLEAGAGWMVKVLAADGVVLRRALRILRAELLAL